MFEAQTFKQAIASCVHVAPNACASDLATVVVEGDLKAARRARSPMAHVHVRTDAAEVSGTIDLVNYSDVRNVERIRQAAVALSLRVVRAGDRSLRIAFNIVDARGGRAISAELASLQKKVRGALVYEQWNVALGARYASIDTIRESVATMSWCPDPEPLTFDADPFVVDRDGRAWLLYEHLGRDNRGRIWAREYADGVFGAPTELINASTHLSYPYVFDHGGETFVMPESSASGRTTAFRLSKTELRVLDEQVVMPDVGVVDPSLIEYDGRYWLFGGLAGLAENAALFIWSADTPFGPFVPHEMNPVKVDVASGRPGGTMVTSARGMLRPAQNCVHRYGGSLALMLVSELSSTTFREEAMLAITPQDLRYSAGIHTLSLHGNLMAVDGLRDMVTLRKLATVF